jgi:pimeloyl-ACP methyl ester carboxylesterase
VDYHEPVSSSIPVLIFSGNLDPATPPQRGQEVAKYLPNSRHVIVPEAGHGMDGLSDQECVNRLIIEFMDKGSAKDLDTSCIMRMAPPPFVTN